MLIDHKGRTNHCAYAKCDKRAHLKTCSGCDKVRYCCEEHARLDWSSHKYHCVAGFGVVKNKRVLEWIQQQIEKEEQCRHDSNVHRSAHLLHDPSSTLVVGPTQG